jgi:hypothetical protein
MKLVDPGSNSGSTSSCVGVFVVNDFTCLRVIADYTYYQYNFYIYDLCMFIRYLVSLTQVHNDT